MHHITDGLDRKKYTGICPLQMPEELNSNLSTSESQQPLQPPDLLHTCLYLPTHPPRGTRQGAPNTFQSPKTFGGRASWSCSSTHQLLYPYMTIWNRSFTPTMGAAVLWGSSSQKWKQHSLFLPEFFHFSVFITEENSIVFKKRKSDASYTWFSDTLKATDRCLKCLIDRVQRTLYTPAFPLRTGKDIFLFFKSWAKEELNKGRRRMWVWFILYWYTHCSQKHRLI